MTQNNSQQRMPIKWGPRFTLSDALVNQSNAAVGGIYLWGFDGFSSEVIWYVGKATARKGLYSRLRKHYLDIMSGQYQIPTGFLNNGLFQTDECSMSGWQMKAGNAKCAGILKDWEQMEKIFRAGHAFANKAFARVAELELTDAELAAAERAAIQQINPMINKHRSMDGVINGIDFLESSCEEGWIEQWQKKHENRQ